MNIREGDLVKIDMKIVKKYDNIEPYIRLVNKIIRNAKGTPYVYRIADTKISIRAWKYDLMGDVTIPKSAVTKVVGNDYNYELK